MAGKKDVAALAAQVDAYAKTHKDWSVRLTDNGQWEIKPPAPWGIMYITAASGRVTAWKNLRAQLKRAGFPLDETVDPVHAQRAAAALAADREANDKALADAERRAARTSITWTDVPPPVTLVAVRSPIITAPPFKAPTTTPEVSVQQDAQAKYDVLKGHGYTINRVLVTQEFALELLTKHQCRQRPLVPTKLRQYKRSFEAGRWRDIPGDIILTDEHTDESTTGYGCLINGKNRLTAIVESDQDKFEHHYPYGVPLYLCAGVHSEDAGVLDIGASRTPQHVLAMSNRKGYSNSSISAALRICMEFDESFKFAKDDPKRRWQNWAKTFDYSPDELSEAAIDPRYVGLTDYDKVGQRTMRTAGIPRAAGAAAAFLIDRDNPDGGGEEHPERTNKEFWDGVCFESVLGPKDPRAALYKFWRGVKDARDKPDKISLFAMAHVMRQYANWHLGVQLTNSVIKESQLMPPVWRPGYKWIDEELRSSKR